MVLPARQSLRILDLLRETTQAIAPAKVLTIGLQSGLAAELSALHAGSTEELRRRLADADRARLDSLELISRRLDSASAAAVREAGGHVRAWWQHAAEAGAGDRASAPAGREATHRYDTAMDALTDLSSRLALETRARDDRVEQLERLSLIWNAFLVVAAFAGLSAVIILAKREHRALEEATMRSRRETVLRETAEAMAAAFTVADVMQCVTDSARRLTGGRSAFIERIIHQATPSLVLCSASGIDRPESEWERPLAGSLTAAVVDAGVPLIIAVPAPARQPATDAERALVIPLGGADRPFGALFVLSDRRDQFQPDDVAHAQVFGHLASLALEKVRVLHEAREGQQKLERVLASRSRLIRGFSHDVKNPIGAADGYAALLNDGIYGELSPSQLESIGRIRRSLSTALSLIHDLHELASAETGHLTVTGERVDVNAIVGGMIEEYQAAARAGGLSLGAALDHTLPMIWTSGVRLQQIVSNLLSNAIKYTPRGSVMVATTQHDTDPAGSPGAWIRVQVADTGAGIPADKQEIIFEEFTRLGPGDKSGAGLGLAISRLLARALGGHLTVESKVGAGSRFTLWLPEDHGSPPA